MFRFHAAAHSSHLAGLLLAGAFAGPAMAAAGDVLIDDFSTGRYHSPQVKSGTQAAEQPGAMLGGYRDTSMFVCDTTLAGDCASRNPFSVNSSYLIDKGKGSLPVSAFVQNVGYQAPPRVEIGYGYGPVPMSANLAGGPGRLLRLTFNALSQPLNFNVLMFTGIGRGQDGCNVLEINHPFMLELPFTEFTPANGGFVAAAIDHIDLIFQNGSAIGSVEFGLTRVEVSDTPAAGAIHCGPIGG